MQPHSPQPRAQRGGAGFFLSPRRFQVNPRLLRRPTRASSHTFTHTDLVLKAARQRGISWEQALSCTRSHNIERLRNLRLRGPLSRMGGRGDSADKAGAMTGKEEPDHLVLLLHGLLGTRDNLACAQRVYSLPRASHLAAAVAKRAVVHDQASREAASVVPHGVHPSSISPKLFRLASPPRRHPRLSPIALRGERTRALAELLPPSRHPRRWALVLEQPAQDATALSPPPSTP